MILKYSYALKCTEINTLGCLSHSIHIHSGVLIFKCTYLFQFTSCFEFNFLLSHLQKLYIFLERKIYIYIISKSIKIIKMKVIFCNEINNSKHYLNDSIAEITIILCVNCTLQSVYLL